MNYELNIKPEVHDVAVLNDVCLTLDAHLASLADGGFRAILDIIVVLDDLGADEALLEVTVDDAGTLWSLHTLAISPGLHFHWAGSNVGLQA